MRHFKVIIWLLTKTLYLRNGQHLSLDKCLLSRSLFFPRFLSTNNSQRQADFSLRSGLGQGSWETFSFFDTGLHFLANRQKRLNTSHKGNVGSCIYQSHFLHLLHTIIRSSKELETFGFHHESGLSPSFPNIFPFLIMRIAHAQNTKIVSNVIPMWKFSKSYISELQAARNFILVSYCAESDRLVK